MTLPQPIQDAIRAAADALLAHAIERGVMAGPLDTEATITKHLTPVLETERAVRLEALAKEWEEQAGKWERIALAHGYKP